MCKCAAWTHSERDREREGERERQIETTRQADRQSDKGRAHTHTHTCATTRVCVEKVLQVLNEIKQTLCVCSRAEECHAPLGTHPPPPSAT